MAYFLSIHNLSGESEQSTYLSLIVGVSHFSYFREPPSPTHPPLPQHSLLFPKPPIMKNKRVLSFGVKTGVQILYRHF